MIKTVAGKIKYISELNELLNVDNLTNTQHDRKSGDGKIKFRACDFTNQDFRNKVFEKLVLDECDFSGSDLRGAIFRQCGLRSALFERCQLDGAEFHKCNLREGSVRYSFAPEIVFYSCNMVGTNIEKLDAPRSVWEYNDMRKVNARGADFMYGEFKLNKMRGMNTRNANFSWSNAPRFFHDEAMQYEFLDPDAVVTAYKLTAADGRGIYHPKITYEVGKTFDAEDQNGVFVPLDPASNTGMAVANMAWVLREWVSCGAYNDYRLFQAQFLVKDIIENEGTGKFNVKKMTIIKEIDMQPFYEMMTENIYED